MSQVSRGIQWISPARNAVAWRLRAWDRGLAIAAVANGGSAAPRALLNIRRAANIAERIASPQRFAVCECWTRDENRAASSTCGRPTCFRSRLWIRDAEAYGQSCAGGAGGLRVGGWRSF